MAAKEEVDSFLAAWLEEVNVDVSMSDWKGFIGRHVDRVYASVMVPVHVPLERAVNTKLVLWALIGCSNLVSFFWHLGMRGAV